MDPGRLLYPISQPHSNAQRRGNGPNHAILSPQQAHNLYLGVKRMTARHPRRLPPRSGPIPSRIRHPESEAGQHSATKAEKTA